MEITELKSKIKSFVERRSEFVCEVLFILNKDHGKEIKMADIDKDDQESLKIDFLDHLEETIVTKADLKINDISRVDERKNFIFRYDYDEQPDDFELFNTIKTQDEFDTFSFAHDKLEEIFGVVFILNLNDLTLITYKQNYPINLYKRDSKAMGLWKSEERLVQIPEDILKVYPNCDLFFLNDDLFIRNLKVLERQFSFEKIINKKATEAIDLIKAVDWIEDTTGLESRLNDLTFARKLAQIGEHSIVLNNLDFSDVANFIDNFPLLTGKIDFNSTQTKVILNTKKSQNLFLKLLNDDFLTSLLTEKNYDSANKDLVDV
ncbi:anti-phage protein KwaB [Lysinibacillus fusiformis]|uniref:anti-phage protein KwaB n=1 Tax=Lysinibacillus fusiformis TaxID=28031 RepID=UPI003D02312E